MDRDQEAYQRMFRSAAALAVIVLVGGCSTVAIVVIWLGILFSRCSCLAHKILVF